MKKRNFTSLVGLILVTFGMTHAVQAADPESRNTVSSSSEVLRGDSFRIRLDPEVADGPISGRLYVFLSKLQRGRPMSGPNWFRPEPFLGMDVKDVEPGDAVVIDDTADGFPEKLSDLPAGKYRVQAFLDHDFYEQHHALGVGNFFSDVINVELGSDTEGPMDLVLNETVEAKEFPESDRVREVVLPSELLSKFHGREVIQRAAVVLPESYEDHPERRYPVLYIIPGFGGSHHMATRYLDVDAEEEDGEEFIRVLLNANCKWGHHVFADSATNGPRGQAFVEEFVPYVDEHFRTVAEPTARFLTGHSSGGWSSLWLQITHPEVFGGVWSLAPDPVDFRDYQGVDLYANPPQSLYFDEEGEQRPIARRGTEPVLWYESFGKMDDVLGRGGQLRSFEAVFSSLGEDGLPEKLWDRTTGEIDPEVAHDWEDYDIRLVLERNWEELEPKLRGKLHIIAAEFDTFYLNGAVERLAEALAALGSDAEVIVVPEASHTSILRSDAAKQIRGQMIEAFREHHPAEASAVAD